MELTAALKERLKSLEADSTYGDEALFQPWSINSSTRGSTRESARAKQTQRVQQAQSTQQAQRVQNEPMQSELVQNTPDLDLSYWDQQSSQCPQAIAIEALQHRARGSDQAAASHADSLVAQEIYRLEVQAHNINERSQQQAAEILAMKRSAQQAAVALRRQGIHDHPQLSAITQLFASYQSAAVPHIERDSLGQFALTYSEVDFHRAEQEAVDTAKALRSRQPYRSAVPFSAPIAPGPALNSLNFSDRSTTDRSTTNERAAITDALHERPYKETLKAAFRKLSESLAQMMQSADPSIEPRGTAQRGSANLFDRVLGAQVAENGNKYRSNGDQPVPFSWPDVAIWFSGAAIARLIIGAAVINHPFIQTPLLIALVGAILFGLYQVVFAKSPNFSLAYRLVAAMLGLFLGSLF